MTNRVLLETVAALLGFVSAFAGAFALVAGLLWLSDQSRQPEGAITLLAASALVLVAVAARSARGGVCTMLAQLPRAGSVERAI
jgi:uncharacterized membrane protein YgdD (TMEM256/DUF423 family)